MPPLIDAAALRDALDADRPVRLLDVRWRLDQPEGRLDYVSGHLPGAVFVDLEHELSWRGAPEDGSHPLPPLRTLQDAARRWGIDAGDLVVAYDDNDSVPAARAWWLLRRRGVDIRVLDGGLRAWVAAGELLERGDVVAAAGSIELLDVDPGTVDIGEAARLPTRGVLVDVRSPSHYRGAAAGADPVAGHIPGAINLPTSSHVDAAGRFRPPEHIRSEADRAGIADDLPVVVYCGSGIASAHSALALSLAGIEPDVFAGSWSQWSRSRGRAVAHGSSPDAVISAV